ncbi:hypothetical protein [Chromobacterium phragmitis]|uniref:hypothetical protein n=1 Tax=Chromobacterium phragmitis TaxID=2202141 RepID=UPI0039A1A807
MEVIYSTAPRTARARRGFGISEVYANVLTDYVLYRAFSKPGEAGSPAPLQLLPDLHQRAQRQDRGRSDVRPRPAARARAIAMAQVFTGFKGIAPWSRSCCSRRQGHVRP